MLTPKNLCARHGLKYTELISLMHDAGYTKFAKGTCSEINSPDDYGVQFTKAAEKAIAQQLNVPRHTGIPASRPCKLQAFVSKQLAHDFTEARLARHQNPTEAVTEAIRLYIREAKP